MVVSFLDLVEGTWELVYRELEEHNKNYVPPILIFFAHAWAWLKEKILNVFYPLVKVNTFLNLPIMYKKKLHTQKVD